jgi:hypothetical protein
MRIRSASAILVAGAVLLLTACSTAAAPSATPVKEAAEPSPASATPTPTPAAELVLSLDGVSFGADEVVSYDDGAGILALFEEISGVMPEGAEVDGYPEGQDPGLTRYDWGEARISVSDEGQAMSVSLTAPELNGVPARTTEGVSVGSTRADVVNAGGWEFGDEDQDGVADLFGLGSREVPGTQSLSRPDAVGIEYFVVDLEGDTVAQIIGPSNDFSDI